MPDLTYFSSKAFLARGNPTPDSDGMFYLPHSYHVVIDPRVTSATAGSADGAQEAGSAREKAASPMITITYASAESAVIAALCGQLDLTDDGGLDLLDRTRSAKLQTLAVVPVDAKEGAIDDVRVWWFPKTITQSIGNFQYEGQSEGEDTENTYSAELISLRTNTDQAGNAIPEGARVGFRNAPANKGLTTWSLPEEFDAPPVT